MLHCVCFRECMCANHNAVKNDVIDMLWGFCDLELDIFGSGTTEPDLSVEYVKKITLWSLKWRAKVKCNYDLWIRTRILYQSFKSLAFQIRIIAPKSVLHIARHIKFMVRHHWHRNQNDSMRNATHSKLTTHQQLLHKLFYL